MKLLPSTSLIYDEFLFGNDQRDVVEVQRGRFLNSIAATPPILFVVSAPLFPNGPDNYAKLSQWPEFGKFLQTNYRLVVERKPTSEIVTVGRSVVAPGYRIYQLRR